ncbi:MAG: LptF/LptG family permease [Alphaproteobacteria bacterium]|nr:LptF/LptG family permease [Alphaproteobacteria bacterium]
MWTTGFQPFALLRQRFFRNTLSSIGIQILLVALLVEAIFLGEKFTALFEDIAARNGRMTDVALLLACTSPEVFDLALALALLLAVYQVLLRARENRELLVVAGAGTGIEQLVAALLSAGVAAFLASVFVSGIVEPAAHYASRVVLFNAEYRALRHGASAGQFYRFPNHVAFIVTPKHRSAERRLFIEEQNPDSYRVMTADGSRIAGPDAKGVLSLELLDYNSFDFVGAAPAQIQACGAGCGSESVFPPVSMQVKHVTQRVKVEQLIPFDPRGSVVDEWTLLELLGLAPPSSQPGDDRAKALGERIARAMLCFLAPFLALTALAFTTTRSQPFAMPIAFLSLMALNLVASAAVRALARYGMPTLTTCLLTGGALLSLGLISVCVRNDGRILRPAMARP